MEDSYILREAPSHKLREASIPRILVALWYLHRHKLDPVPIPCLHKELAITIIWRFNIDVPFFWIDQDAISLAAEPFKSFKHHDSIAEIGTVGRILAVCVV